MSPYLAFRSTFLSYDETIERILAAIADGRRCQHVALNVAKLVNARTDDELDRDIRASDIVGVDGMGIVSALRLLGHPISQRVAGADLFESLMAACAAHGLRPYLLGATPEVLASTKLKLAERYPNLVLAGSHHGYFKSEQEKSVCDLIRASGAHCLFIAMPTPRKERFMARHRDNLGVPFVMGVGGTYDVVAGHVKRAPALVQSFGLEWAYRMLSGAAPARGKISPHQSHLRRAAGPRIAAASHSRRAACQSDFGVTRS